MLFIVNGGHEGEVRGHGGDTHSLGGAKGQESEETSQNLSEKHEAGKGISLLLQLKSEPAAGCSPTPFRCGPRDSHDIRSLRNGQTREKA